MKRNHKQWRKCHETKDFPGRAWKTNWCQERRGRRVISPARRNAGLLWVMNVVSSVLQRLPLFTQVQTYRCIALSDVPGHLQTSPAQRYTSFLACACRRKLQLKVHTQSELLHARF